MNNKISITIMKPANLLQISADGCPNGCAQCKTDQRQPESQVRTKTQKERSRIA